MVRGPHGSEIRVRRAFKDPKPMLPVSLSGLPKLCRNWAPQTTSKNNT